MAVRDYRDIKVLCPPLCYGRDIRFSAKIWGNPRNWKPLWEGHELCPDFQKNALLYGRDITLSKKMCCFMVNKSNVQTKKLDIAKNVWSGSTECPDLVSVMVEHNSVQKIQQIWIALCPFRVKGGHKALYFWV